MNNQVMSWDDVRISIGNRPISRVLSGNSDGVLVQFDLGYGCKANVLLSISIDMDRVLYDDAIKDALSTMWFRSLHHKEAYLVG